MAKPPFNTLDFAVAQVEVERRASGTLILRSPQVLGPYARHLGVYLQRWAREVPRTVFLAERLPSAGWRRVSYAEMLAMVESIGQWLLDHEFTTERPLMLLSENSIDLAAMTLAGMYAGVPVVPVSPAYSLMSRDHKKLKAITALVKPGLIYASDGGCYSKALSAIVEPGCQVVLSNGELPEHQCVAFSTLQQYKATSDAAHCAERLDPDSVAKILFTSGSTGEPKGVMTTHRMLCANQQGIAQCWPFLEQRPPLILDWLPWSHAFGANHNFNLILRNGGTLYIDEGKPIPGLIERTVENLKEVSPTIYFNAPRGYDMLLHYLERDSALAAKFFQQLDLIVYAAAALPQQLWERLEAVSIRVRGERVRMVSSWGSTETTSSATSVHFTIEKAGVIGLPVPGVEIMLTPTDDKMELRVRGPIVTPGYWRRPDLTQSAFDEEGFYLVGDSGHLDDPTDPAKGIVFDGRIAEDFKLSSGTWVQCGSVRLGAISACSPLVQDMVLTGRDREAVGALIFLNLSACRAMVGEPGLTVAEAVGNPKIRNQVREGLARFNVAHPSSSMRIAYGILVPEPPSIDAGEVTDKGYINQRAVTEHRASLVDKLYAESPEDSVLVLGLGRGVSEPAMPA
jgi:feruloyl-CoA synthase